MSDPNIQTDADVTPNSEMPLSRFWACFFAGTIFALFWTQKMGKTAQWIPVFFMFLFVWFVLDVIIYPVNIEDFTTIDKFLLYHYERDMEFVESLVYSGSGFLVDVLIPASVLDSFVYVLSLTFYVFYDMIVPIGSITLLIYLMFKWTGEYNLKHFKYKNKREWKKSINNSYNTTQNMKKEIKIIGGEVRDEIVSTASKITKIRRDDKTISKIKKYHALMEQGIISEKEFGDKKADLLKSKKSK